MEIISNIIGLNSNFVLLNVIGLALGLFLLIKGSDIFVDAGTVIGKAFKMSEILIGLTIVCVGTGLPELLLGITGASNGSSELVIGNIVGSNIFNMCVILGMICVLKPLKLLRETIRKDLNMSLISGLALLFLLLDNLVVKTNENIISMTDGLILLLFFLIFMYYTFYQFAGYIRFKREKAYQEKLQHKKKGEIVQKPKTEFKFTEKDIKKILINSGIAIIGILMVHFGATFTVDNAVFIAKHFNVSQTFISIAIIAVGTSLPELSTSIAAMKKNRVNIAIGNLIGSNMFNTLLVLGTSSLINPLKLEGSYLLVDCVVFIIVCIALRMFVRKKTEISRFEGFSLISIYILYISYVLFRH